MTDSVLLQIFADFKSCHSTNVTDSGDLFLVERGVLEYVIGLGRRMIEEVFSEMDRGYEGSSVEHQGGTYKFHGYRTTTLHGLFGPAEYSRAYYVPADGGSGGYFPLDERLGIDKRHTPGCQYFLSSFTGREAYQKSLGRFHEIFRPDGKDLISLRKALDMDAQVGERLERRRQQEIDEVFVQRKEPSTEQEIQGIMAVSVDATKLREKGEEKITAESRKSYEIAWKDVKVGSVSQVGWDDKRQEAYCTKSSYVGGIEHADEFFKRLYVEMKRRTANLPKQKVVFLADGGNWIWERMEQVAPQGSVFILDYFHACEHVSDVCKQLYGQETPAYWKHFKRWKGLLYEGGVTQFLRELKQLRYEQKSGDLRQFLQGQLDYFQQHKERMHYDRYRALHLPIGSGTIESACKNVIGGRMKQGGMTWSEKGADGMVQVRCSIESGRFMDDFLASLDLVA